MHIVVDKGPSNTDWVRPWRSSAHGKVKLKGTEAIIITQRMLIVLLIHVKPPRLTGTVLVAVLLETLATRMQPDLPLTAPPEE